MGLGTFGAVLCVRLFRARPSRPFEWWVGLAILQIFLCVLISSQFLQQISLQVVFFLLAAFQALGHCNLIHILFPLLLPQLSFGLLRGNEIASELLPLPRLGNLPRGGLFLRFSRIKLEFCHQHQVVSFFGASKLSLKLSL